jgi:hypothetical protein
VSHALLGQAARVLLVALPVLDVDFLVDDVHVAAQDHLTLLLQLGEMRHEFVHEAVLRLLALFAARAGRHVHRHDRQLAVTRLDVAPLGIEFAAAEADDHVVGLTAAVHARTAVALLRRVMEVAPEAVRLDEFGRQVVGRHLDFLHAHAVGVLFAEPVEEALLRGGADAVQVGGNHSHHVGFRGSVRFDGFDGIAS